ncbi:MAG TPA: zinc-dependent metalloprotease family protein [Bacteroidia bacterium]|jgi:hypothetical protein|nr:zinc-dependent metalloprotease family protein [Bacteroidia bacterium]
MKKITTLILATSLTCFVNAQNTKKIQLWESVNESKIKLSGERVIIPQKAKTFHLVNDNLKKTLWAAPHENTVRLQESQCIIELPMPDGSLMKFRVVESPVMAPELCAAYPMIKTFNVMGVDQPGTYGKLDFTMWGFHAMLRGTHGDIYIDPFCRFNNEDYNVYYLRDYIKDASKILPEVDVLDKRTPEQRMGSNSTQAMVCVGPQLRTYRTAIACTGEYAMAATGLGSPTVAQTLACIVTTLNRVDGVYETDLSIKMVLVPTETVVVYTNPSTDPFTGNNNANTLINESQTVIDNNIGDANYDAGHTFSTGGGGLSTLGGVCLSGQKASSITGSPTPTGDGYDIDYVAHEMGHNFGGNHTFRSTLGSCSGNYNPGTMVEPGSGITVMAYAGICGTDDDSAHSIPYFHTISYDEIVAYTNSGSGNTCPVTTNSGNHAPVVTGSANYTVPKSTPFILTGSATDQDGDPLTYQWEEIDNNNSAGAWNSGAKPFFRSYNPVSIPSRMFPKLSVVQSGTYTTTIGEFLPTTQQTLNFRLIARDNKMGGGGVCYALTTVTVSSTAGPLAITYPNATGITWASAGNQTITWAVNGTTGAPINCANVNILISYDSGSTWTMLMPNVANSGSQLVTVPTVTATISTCRIKVESVGNIFFDISHKDFTITAGSTGIATASNNTIAMQLVPNPANEQVSINLYGLNANEKNNLVIYDMLGNVVLKDALSGKENYEMNYDLSQFSKGVYLVEISGTNKKAVSRLVKQ